MLSVPGASQSLSLEGYGGVAFPAGDLAKMQSAGATFGVGIGAGVHPRVGLRLDVEASILEGKEVGNGTEFPGINQVHVLGGVETPLYRSAGTRRPLTLSASLGAGVTLFEVEAFVVPQGRPQAGRSFVVQESYPAVGGGLRLALALSRSANVVLSAHARRVFLDGEDVAVLGLISDRVQSPEAAWSLPLTLSARLRL